ncbi:hypothetical protein NHX12_011347 [Muraenolepis orangiensis]|uniref:Kazal-like domain-containing protein n=1 Tax=Muraenolepis orangiensis TaxID=630683 RepID=A0A9Q0DIQ8_9TELE|nr:hypothetical protein NHX12_011347 [Muraenolepis orangiensis]
MGVRAWWSSTMNPPDFKDEGLDRLRPVPGWPRHGCSYRGGAHHGGGIHGGGDGRRGGSRRGDPCLNHHCKKGKVCEADEDNSPMCVCQDPSTCTPATGDFEHVCGTDNKTYDSSCHFFATKCALEGTKKGHKLHLDYIGPCKFLETCVDLELSEFPLRMRDWLKNVLVTLFERDEDNNLLTEKQKVRVQKIFENVKRLDAGEHSLDLLAHDFEKNYNMYIFPRTWTRTWFCKCALAVERQLLVHQ